jgi:hypothetical protein
MKTGAIMVIGAVLALAGCGGSGDGDTGTAMATQTGTATTAADGSNVTGKLPPGAIGPVDTAEQTAEGPAAAEASPESAAEGPQSRGELEGTDRSAATGTVRSYISALDDRDAVRVCALIEQGGCPASIASRPAGGGPAWRRTEIVEMKPESLGNDRARVTTTVTHHFSDRKYVSVEDDVIYLERVGGRWIIAKPSATFYRAVGYAQPPLRAFAPPPGW